MVNAKCDVVIKLSVFGTIHTHTHTQGKTYTSSLYAGCNKTLLKVDKPQPISQHIKLSTIPTFNTRAVPHSPGNQRITFSQHLQLHKSSAHIPVGRISIKTPENGNVTSLQTNSQDWTQQDWNCADNV